MIIKEALGGFWKRITGAEKREFDAEQARKMRLAIQRVRGVRAMPVMPVVSEGRGAEEKSR